MNTILQILDNATKSAAGKRVVLSLATAATGVAMSRLGLPASVSTAIGPDVVQIIADALMGLGAAGIAAFNAINHRAPVDRQDVVTQRPN